MDIHERVMYVDFIGEGVICKDWPRGYILTHGSEGTIVRWEKGFPPTILSSSGKTLPGDVDRPIVAFNINWFRKMWERQFNERLPPFLYEEESYNPHVLISPKSQHHIIRLSDRGEVRKVEEVRKKVEEILHTMKWPDIIKYMPDGEERAFLLRHHPKSEKDLPGEMPLIVRKIASYNFLQFTFEQGGNSDLQSKYERLMQAQILDLERHAGKHDIVIDRSAPTRTPRRDEKMAKKAANKAKVEAPAKTTKKKGKGYDQEDIKAALKTVKAEESPIVKLAKDTFGVVIPKGSLASAPNAGVMKMRAGNMIRNALKTAGQFAE